MIRSCINPLAVCSRDTPGISLRCGLADAIVVYDGVDDTDAIVSYEVFSHVRRRGTDLLVGPETAYEVMATDESVPSVSVYGEGHDSSRMA